MNASRSFAKRLSRKLVIKTGALFIVSVFLLGLFSYYYIYMAAVKDADSMLKQTCLEVEAILAKVETTTQNSVWIVDRYSSDPQMLQAVVQNLVSGNGNVVSAVVALESGVFCATAPERDESDYKDKDWYQIPMRTGKPYWSDPMLDSDESGKLVSYYSVPLYCSDGSFCGVVRSDVDVDWLTEKLRQIQPYEHSYTMLFSRGGDVVTRTDELSEDDKTHFSDSLKFHLLSGKRDVERFRTGGQKGVIIYGSLNNGWPVAIVCTDNDVMAETKKMNAISLLIGCFAVFLLYLGIKKTIERESKAVAALSYTALSIAQGNFNSIIPEVESKDELKRLRDSLSYLEDSIHRYIYELRNSTEANHRFESELNIASAIQMQMLPKDYPQFEGVDLYATLHPAKEVGGDLYDFFVKDRTLYFAVGDVSGKGVPAALYMAITRSAFRFIAGLGLPVSGVVSRINNAFCDGNDSGMFVTMFVARINLDTLEMEFCNAGHNPILIISPDGKAEYLHAKVNLAAGLFENFPYQGETMQVQKGSRLLVYTDGVTEAENVEKKLYSEQRLVDYASSEPTDKSSEDFISDLLDDMKKFTRGNDQNDDITIMSIKL